MSDALIQTRKVIAGLFFFIVTLLIWKKTYDYTLLKFFFTQIFILFLLLSFLFEKKKLSFNLLLLSPLFIYFFFFLLSLSFSSSPLVCFRQLNIFLSYLILFLVGFNLREVLKGKWVFFIWIIAGIVASVWVMYDYFKGGIIVASFGNKNFFSGYVILLLPLVISFLLQKKWIFALPFFFLFFALYLSNSQASFLGFFSSVLFFLFYFLRDRKKLQGRAIFFIFACIFLLSVFSLPYFITTIQENIRYPFYVGTARMIKEKPLLGFGPGKFEASFQEFRPREYFIRQEATPIDDHAHCEYLEIAAETGIPSLFFFLVFIIVFFSLFKERLKRDEDWFILSSLGAGILAVLVDNMFSTNLRTYSVPPLFWFSMGLVSSSFPERKISTKASSLIFIILSLIIIIFIPFNLREINGQIYYKQGLIHRNRGEYRKAIYFFNRSLESSPFNLDAFYKLGYLYVMTNQPRKALLIYDELLRLSPHFARSHYNIATVLASLGEKEEAIHHLKVALDHNPYDEESFSFLKYLISSQRLKKEEQIE